MASPARIALPARSSSAPPCRWLRRRRAWRWTRRTGPPTPAPRARTPSVHRVEVAAGSSHEAPFETALLGCSVAGPRHHVMDRAHASARSAGRRLRPGCASVTSSAPPPIACRCRRRCGNAWTASTPATGWRAPSTPAASPVHSPTTSSSGRPSCGSRRRPLLLADPPPGRARCATPTASSTVDVDSPASTCGRRAARPGRAHRRGHRRRPLVADAVPERRYYANNPAFGIGDASMLFGMLRLHRPSRIVEIGSGYSSALILDVVERHLPGTSVTFVEPYTELLRSLMHEGDEARCEILEQRAQDVSLERARRARGRRRAVHRFDPRRAHGQRRLPIVLEVLPALRPGVVVHVHDIFWPFELPRTWVEEGRQWAECYLLRAFLTDNPRLAASCCSTTTSASTTGRSWSACCRRFLENTGGSLWLQRV